MGKIEQNREKKRRAILSAAKGLFLSEGYIHTSMDKIAKQAQVTKQTVYRYYPSKVELFEAMLSLMDESVEIHFEDNLNNPDTRQAMIGFAKGFTRFHLSDEHIAIYRLLVSESAKAPEMAAIFRAIGPDDTGDMLETFFVDRLGIERPDNPIRFWLGMLLSLRGRVLMGMQKPTEEQISQHAIDATEFLLAAITTG